MMLMSTIFPFVFTEPKQTIQNNHLTTNQSMSPETKYAPANQDCPASQMGRESNLRTSVPMLLPPSLNFHFFLCPGNIILFKKKKTMSHFFSSGCPFQFGFSFASSLKMFNIPWIYLILLFHCQYFTQAISALPYWANCTIRVLANLITQFPIFYLLVLVA